MRTTPLALSLIAAGVLTTSALSASADPGTPIVAQPAAATVLAINFDGGTRGAVIAGSDLANGGSAAIVANVLTRGTAVAGDPTRKPRATYRAGVTAAADTAARFPGFVAADQDPPLAIIAITNAEEITDPAVDPLNPGTGAFSWSADFRLDAASGGSAADGDNLFQRGLNPDTQWKLQIDRGRAVCAVRAANTSTGAITEVKTTPIAVDPNTWYRATCARTSQSQLTVVIEQYVKGALQSIGSGTAPTKVRGTLAMDPATPVSVGGKLRSADTIVRPDQSPSQFNGAVDNVVLSIG